MGPGCSPVALSACSACSSESASGREPARRRELARRGAAERPTSNIELQPREAARNAGQLLGRPEGDQNRVSSPCSLRGLAVSVVGPGLRASTSEPRSANAAPPPLPRHASRVLVSWLPGLLIGAPSSPLCFLCWLCLLCVRSLFLMWRVVAAQGHNTAIHRSECIKNSRDSQIPSMGLSSPFMPLCRELWITSTIT